MKKQKPWVSANRLCWLFVSLLVFFMFGGCSASKENQQKVRDLEIHVAGELEIPEELSQMIGEKKAQPFKLTYTDEKNLFIAIGYGAQPTGGYSISVEELYLTENSIVIRTELKGPGKGENSGTERSFPFIVVQTEFLEHPVVFK
jgi:hypothetical protein